jgi:hypothetical protein
MCSCSIYPSIKEHAPSKKDKGPRISGDAVNITAKHARNASVQVCWSNALVTAHHSRVVRRYFCSQSFNTINQSKYKLLFAIHHNIYMYLRIFLAQYRRWDCNTSDSVVLLRTCWCIPLHRRTCNGKGVNLNRQQLPTDTQVSSMLATTTRASSDKMIHPLFKCMHVFRIEQSTVVQCRVAVRACSFGRGIQVLASKSPASSTPAPSSKCISAPYFPLVLCMARNVRYTKTALVAGLGKKSAMPLFHVLVS